MRFGPGMRPNGGASLSSATSGAAKMELKSAVGTGVGATLTVLALSDEILEQVGEIIDSAEALIDKAESLTAETEALAESAIGIKDSLATVVNSKALLGRNIGSEMEQLGDAARDTYPDELSDRKLVSCQWILPAAHTTGITPDITQMAVNMTSVEEFLLAAGVQLASPNVAEHCELQLMNVMGGFASPMTGPQDRDTVIVDLKRCEDVDRTLVHRQSSVLVDPLGILALSELGALSKRKIHQEKMSGTTVDSWDYRTVKTIDYLEAAGIYALNLAMRYSNARIMFNIVDSNPLQLPQVFPLTYEVDAVEDAEGHEITPAKTHTHNLIIVDVPSWRPEAMDFIMVHSLGILCPELARVAVGGLDARGLRETLDTLLADDDEYASAFLLRHTTVPSFFTDLVRASAVYRTVLRGWTQTIAETNTGRPQGTVGGFFDNQGRYHFSEHVLAAELETVRGVSSLDRHTDVICKVRHQVEGPVPPTRAIYVPTQRVSVGSDTFKDACIYLGGLTAVAGQSGAGKTTWVWERVEQIRQALSDVHVRPVLVRIDEPHDQYSTSMLATKMYGSEVEVWRAHSPHPSIVDAIQRTVAEKYPDDHIVLILDSMTPLQMTVYNQNVTALGAKEGVNDAARSGICWTTFLCHPRITSFAIYNTPSPGHYRLLNGANTTSFYLSDKTGTHDRLTMFRDRWLSISHKDNLAGTQSATHEKHAPEQVSNWQR